MFSKLSEEQQILKNFNDKLSGFNKNEDLSEREIEKNTVVMLPGPPRENTHMYTKHVKEYLIKKLNQFFAVPIVLFKYEIGTFSIL